MHREYASADRELADGPVVGEPPDPLDDGLLLHAAASSAAAIMTVMKAATRAAGNRDCVFMAASVQASGSGRVTRRGERGSIVGGIRRRVARR